MPFESLVRPFQSPGALGGIIIPAKPGASTERATLTWGAQAEGRVIPKRSGINVECCRRGSVQNKAKYENVSVEAPAGGPSAGQRVDFQRANVVAFKDSHKNDCISDWDQMSGVAFGVHEALAEFEADMSFSEVNDPEETCQTSWKLNNNPTGKP